MFTFEGPQRVNWNIYLLRKKWSCGDTSLWQVRMRIECYFEMRLLLL